MMFCWLSYCSGTGSAYDDEDSRSTRTHPDKK